MRQPDIEIYLRDDHVNDLLDWLHQAMGPLTLDEPKGLTQHGALRGDQTIPLMVVRKAAGKWASIWFDSDATPWESDRDCARAVHAAIQGCARGRYVLQQGARPPGSKLTDFRRSG